MTKKGTRFPTLAINVTSKTEGVNDMSDIEKIKDIADFLIRTNPSQETLKNLIELLDKERSRIELLALLTHRLSVKTLFSDSVLLALRHTHQSATYN